MVTYSLKTAAKATVEHAGLASLRRATGIVHALTLWPEWVWPIAHLDKRCENRGWKLPDSMLGKRIAIHAGAAIGGRKGLPARREGIRSMLDTARGAGWALTVETGALKLTKGSALIIAPLPMHSALREDLPIVTSAIVCTAVLASCTEPHEPAPDDGWYMGEYGFRLADVQVLPEPIACAGAQGFWRLP